MIKVKYTFMATYTRLASRITTGRPAGKKESDDPGGE